MTVRAVLLDFYGTLAEATHWVSIDAVLAERGYELPQDALRRWWNEGVDGIEHLEHSVSRDRYVAWQQERMLAMLAETDVHPGEYHAILEKLRAGASQRVLEPYPEVADVLRELRERGLRLAICSNCDWDLAAAVDDVGLTDLVDVQVSSAWAGARKPHPRIFHHTLEKVGVPAAEALFVGDTWGPDVEGPRAVGMAPAYVAREAHWPDPGAPDAPIRTDIPVLADLRGILTLV
jgi:putative hydrolase of the HAD superfamily